jgi:hypothetical protein
MASTSAASAAESRCSAERAGQAANAASCGEIDGSVLLGLQQSVRGLVKLFGAHVHGFLHFARGRADKLGVAVFAEALVAEYLEKIINIYCLMNVLRHFSHILLKQIKNCMHRLIFYF